MSFASKALRCCFVSVILFLSFASLLPADIISTFLGPPGVASFTLAGNTFQFQSSWDIECSVPADPVPDCTGYFADSSVSAITTAEFAVTGGAYGSGNQAPGALINEGLEYGSTEFLLERETDPGGNGIGGAWRGYGIDADPGYAGFRFQDADGYHYGWVLIGAGGPLPSPSDPNAHLTGSYLAYAYESCPDQAIVVGTYSGGGTCSEPPESTPEPATATLLVVGLAGFELFYRRLFKSRLCLKLE